MAHFDPFGAMTSSQVKVDDFLLPGSRREAHQVQPWLAVAEQPRVQNVSTDGLSWFRNDTSWNNSGVEEFLRALEYNPIGGLGHYSTGAQDASELGVLDDLLGGMPETGHFLAASEICREYEGFLLNQDIAGADKVFFEANHDMSKGLVPRNSSSESQLNVAYIGTAESTTAAADVLEAQFKTTGSVTKTRICPPEMHGTRLDFEASYDISGNNLECCEQENHDQIDTEPSAPGWKWKSAGRRSKRVVKKCSGAKLSDQERSKDAEEEFFTGAVLQTPHESLPRKVTRKRQPVFTDLKPDDLYTSSESEDGRKNKTLGCKNRRKHHVMWTTAEVSNLIEGVAQYGIGRWTDIKKFHFSSSTHRTPIDIRDKWRNLVKSSRNQKRWNQGVDQRQPSRLVLSEAQMGRVVELATIHVRNNKK